LIDSTFRGAVDKVSSAQCGTAANGTDVDDATTLGLTNHSPACFLGTQKSAGQVDTDNPVPIFQRKFLWSFSRNDTHVIDQNINPSKFRIHLVEKCSNILPLAGITMNCKSLSLPFLDFGVGIG
jgi:hypothetical protein